MKTKVATPMRMTLALMTTKIWKILTNMAQIYIKTTMIVEGNLS